MKQRCWHNLKSHIWWMNCQVGGYITSDERTRKELIPVMATYPVQAKRQSLDPPLSWAVVSIINHVSVGNLIVRSKRTPSSSKLVEFLTTEPPLSVCVWSKRDFGTPASTSMSTPNSPGGYQQRGFCRFLLSQGSVRIANLSSPSRDKARRVSNKWY